MDVTAHTTDVTAHATGHDDNRVEGWSDSLARCGHRAPAVVHRSCPRRGGYQSRSEPQPALHSHRGGRGGAARVGATIEGSGENGRAKGVNSAPRCSLAESVKGTWRLSFYRRGM